MALISCFDLIIQMEQIDPDVKALFDQVGLSENMLKDKDTAKFIYDFLENHGGVEAVKQERQRPPPPKAAPPVVPPVQSYSMQAGKQVFIIIRQF